MGITAKKEGFCPLCRSAIYIGQQIDRTGQKDAKGYDVRAHVECLQPAQPVVPRQAPPPPPPVQTAPAPLPNVIALNGADYHGSTTTHIVSMRCGLEQAIQGLQTAMVALDHVLAARQEAARGGHR